jgi:GntR family transcriptional regulator
VRSLLIGSIGVDLSRDTAGKRGDVDFRAASPVPSSQVEQVLRQRLLREFQPGSRFSSELELCREFRVSRALLRPILARLIEEGILKRNGRLGTVVAKPGTEAQGPQLSDLVSRLEDYWPNTSVTVLDIAAGPGEPKFLKRLGLDAAEPVTTIRRLLTLDGVRVSYLISCLAADLGARLTRDLLEQHPLAWILTNKLDITIRKAVQTVEPVVADIDAATLLEVPIGTPLLLVERDFLGRDDKPIFYTCQYFRGDRYKFSATLHWNKSVRRPARHRKAMRR